MEIFMQNIPYSADPVQVSSELAKVLHSSRYVERNQGQRMNFNIFLHPQKRATRWGPGIHGGTGSLTLPDVDLGAQFLQDCGGRNPIVKVVVASRTVAFSVSTRKPRKEVLENVRRLPYVDPRAQQAKEGMIKELTDSQICIKVLQFGWECRDEVLSVEWEKDLDSSFLQFDGESREIRLKIPGPERTEIVAISFSQIEYTAASEASGQPVIFLSLQVPPTFESELPASTLQEILESHRRRHPQWQGSVYEIFPRQRLSSLDDIEHRRISPFISLALRLICDSRADLSTFRHLIGVANLQKPNDFDYRVERRGLFSARIIRQLESWFAYLDLSVAYQAEALVRNRCLDAAELLDLRGEIQHLTAVKGANYCAAFLRHFRVEINKIWWYSEDNQNSQENAKKCYLRSLRDFKFSSDSRRNRHTTQGDFDCLHVTITPTSMALEGPFVEMSNRVIRNYLDHQGCFLRVVFADENRLQYRFDRSVDGPTFVKNRVGGILHHGFTLAGRKFDFLAYSQSALKEHAVWFVTPFHDRTGKAVTASSIIKSLGTFDNLHYDKRLIYCPARYGARVSQAFTTTDASIAVDAEEIFYIDDIERNGSCFTDGVGTISSLLASDICKALATRRRLRGPRTIPRAFQVRFMGSKGMLSVDYKLKHRELCLRQSMIKFEAPDSTQIEIARAFDKPGMMYLNRPLIMVLEDLGVPAQVFLDFQEKAVLEVKESTRSISRAARLLESHGLGTSFRLTSILVNLDKLSLSLNDPFYRKMLDFAVNHILRELKHHARIPVPGWTLVGVADEHSYLPAGTIFACVHKPGSRPIYLEGPVLITRSPVIHPGDIQIVTAIGKPLAGSPFEKETLENTVVFSTQGERSLPSCLGGGDLDGDTYNVTPCELLHPTKTCPGAAYDPAERNELDHPSTMSDVADFIVEYINSDILGVIAINWLIIADQSERGIFDPGCLTLAQLHSDAVDYPKSGRPVPITSVPRLKFRAKPDWNAPETVKPGADFYESRRAIGKLFRAIDLPDMREHSHQGRKRHHSVKDEQEDDDLHALQLPSIDEYGPVHRVLQKKVSEFTDTLVFDPEDAVSLMDLFKKYSSELQYICSTHTLSYSRSAQLTEEEAIIGTIVAKCSQPRRRKERMSSLREQTAVLISDVRDELEGEATLSHEERLGRAWWAWEISLEQIKNKTFGARSFWYVCLGAIFEVLKTIEDEERGW